MVAVIIAGGKGTRLKEIAEDIPKPMIKIGNKALLEHQIEIVAEYGIKNIYLMIGHLGFVIKEYFGNGNQLGVNIRYFEEDKPLGTAGCLSLIKCKIENDFVLLYGDIMANFKVDDFIDFHNKYKGAATLIIHPNNHPFDSDIVVTKETQIIDFYFKNNKPNYYRNLVNAGIYILSPKVFDYIPNNKFSDFVKDIFPNMLKNNEKIYGYLSTEYIKDIGTVERYKQVNDDYITQNIYKKNKKNKRPAIFFDRDGTLIKYIELLSRVEQLELYPFTGSCLRKINKSNYFSFIVTNQPVIARNLIDLETLNTIHNKFETLIGKENAYIDSIRFCPHHPDKGYPEENPEYKIGCECRKPKTGMIEELIEEYSVDVENSWIVGDSTVDIMTGINAGMRTILVQTGLSGKDAKYNVNPDFIFDDAEHAVDFILFDEKKYKTYIDNIINKYGNSKKMPFIINVGGLSRSGKSTFSSVLKYELSKRNIIIQALSLDHWIIGKDKRRDEMTVRERFQYELMNEDIKKIVNNEEIYINKYDSLTCKSNDRIKIKFEGTDILVIEGVPVIDNEFLRNLADINIYIETDEYERSNRFKKYYSLKGYSEEEIKELYKRREIDEHQIIRDSKKYSDFLIRII